MLQRHFSGSGENYDLDSVFLGEEAVKNPIMFGHFLVPGNAVYEQCVSNVKVRKSKATQEQCCCNYQLCHYTRL